jgi:hypothetical protein
LSGTCRGDRAGADVDGSIDRAVLIVSAEREAIADLALGYGTVIARNS